MFATQNPASGEIPLQRNAHAHSHLRRAAHTKSTARTGCRRTSQQARTSRHENLSNGVTTSRTTNKDRLCGPQDPLASAAAAAKRRCPVDPGSGHPARRRHASMQALVGKRLSGPGARCRSEHSQPPGIRAFSPRHSCSGGRPVRQCKRAGTCPCGMQTLLLR